MTISPLEDLPFSGDIELLDFDSDNLGREIDEVKTEDLSILQQIETLSQNLNWHEKLALSIHAAAAIDTSHRQLCEVKPKHGTYSPNLTAAIALLRHLSAGGKASWACQFLDSDWDLETSEDAPSITIE